MHRNLNEINEKLKDKEPHEIIAWAYETFGSKLVMSSSFGIHSAPMLHLVTSKIPHIPIIFVDTGYLFPETYRFAIQMVNRYKINLKVCSSIITPTHMERTYGKMWEHGEPGIAKYNELRKITPLRELLSDLHVQAIMHGVHKDQTEHRSTMQIVEHGFNGTIKIHPILNWTQRDVDTYFIIHELPYHPLYNDGYDSIGDVHSTIKGQGRNGRLLGKNNECGIHIPVNYSI